MADHGKIVLHAFWLSSCTWRVRLSLAYKEIPFEYKAWNISKGEHLTEEYKKINPVQFVPSLEIDGAILNDSIAILEVLVSQLHPLACAEIKKTTEYLEERFPEKKPLLPKDLKERAAIRSFVNVIASGIQPLQNLQVLKTINEEIGPDSRLDWAQRWITKGFEVLESILEKTAGEYCFGDEFTMADVVLVPQVNNALRFKIDLGKFPTLERVHTNIFKLDFVVNSKPDCQPDSTRILPN